MCLCGSAGFLPAPRPRARTSRPVSAHPAGLGVSRDLLLPRVLSIPGCRGSPRGKARRQVPGREESCKVRRGVGRSEEERRKRRTRLSSRSDRGVLRRLSRSSPQQLDASLSAPGWAPETRREAARNLSCASCRRGPHCLCSNSPESGVGGLDSVHWDLPRVPAAAVAAAETLFVLPGPRSLPSVAAVGWL